MANNYRKKSTTARRGNMAGQLLLVCVCFVAGYLSASLYDIARLSDWVSTNILAKNVIPTAAQPGVAVAQLPKPKFEFYTLLANEQVAGSSQPTTQQPTAVLPVKELPLHAPLAPTTVLATASSAPAAVSPVATTAAKMAPENKLPALLAGNNTNNKDAYLVQVASFRSMREAERMKISLVMKGLDVKIATINQQQVNWYRVFIGPFSSHTQAQQAQLAFAKREHVMGMIRRMDA